MEGATPGRPHGQPSRQGRAWWQWLLSMVLFGGAALVAVYNYVPGLRPSSTVKRVKPQEVRVAPELAAVDAIPAEPGDLADCNVLIVTFDTTRADHIGSYGYDKATTPALDRLAREGVLFSEAVAPSPTTLPSHASIMTGLYPVHHGARANNTFRLGDENVTLAEVLSRHGYATGAFVSSIVLDSQFGIDQGFREFDADFPMSDGDRMDAARSIAQRPADQTNERAEAWLRAHADGKFAAWVHYYDPHFPYEAPPPFSDDHSLAYDAEIAFADFHLGRLLALLDELQVTERTLIVVAGDHGEGLGEHDEFFHSCQLYESTMRVPLVLRCGTRLGNGVHVSAPVSLVDIMPTVLSLLGIQAPDGLDGVDLTKPPSPDRPIYVETFQALADHGWASLLGVRTASAKYIYGPESELYDLSSDPFEQRDVVGDRPDLAAAMHERLQALFGADLDLASTAKSTHTLSSADLAKLQSLGYLAGTTSDATPARDRPHPRDMMPLLVQADRALLVYQDEGLDAGIAALEKVCEKHPTFATAFKYLGDKYVQRGDLEAAEDAYIRCIEIRPNDLQPIMALAGLAMTQRNIDEAIDLYREVLTRDPGHFAALNDLGRALRRRGEFSDAAEVLTMALSIYPSDESLPDLVAETYASLGRGGEAVELFRKHLEASPDLPNVRNALAGMIVSPPLLDFAGAIALLREGLELAPDRLTLANNLAYLLAVCPNPQYRRPLQAAVLMEQACQETAFLEPHYMNTLGMVYATMSRFDEAIAMAERARETALASKRADYAQLVPAIGLAIQKYMAAKQSSLKAAAEPAGDAVPSDAGVTADSE